MKRRTAFITLILIILAVLAWGVTNYFRLNNEPAWTHHLPGKGQVYAFASCQPVGKGEVLVAAGCADVDEDDSDYHLVGLEPETGRVLWQTRQPMTIKGYINLEPQLAEAEDGHVLLGSKWTAIPDTSRQALAKHDSQDGHLLWQCTISQFAPDAYRGAGFSAIPAARMLGSVWVTGIYPVAEQTYSRFVALVDQATGQTRWQTQCNSARDVFDAVCNVHPLSVADAIVVSPPHHHERSYPWFIQRVSEITGEVLWSRQFTRDNERNLPDIAWLVDETRGQMLVFWSEVVRGGWQGQVIALNLTDGRNLWKTTSDFPKTLGGGILAAHLDAKGTVSLWGREETQRTRVLWWKWTWDPELPIPFPAHEMKLDVRPIRLDLSAIDGKTTGKTILLHDDQSPIGMLRDPVTDKPMVIILRQMRLRDQIEPWSMRALEGCRLRASVGGPGAKLWQPKTAFLTRSGRVVVANDPAEETVSWKISAW